MVQNNKGFMLVEVIVTTTVVLTTMIALYAGFNKMYINYNVRNSYYSIDGIYAIKEMINAMMTSDGDDNFNKVINTEIIVNEEIKDINYFFLIKDGKCEINGAVCTKIKDLYDVKNMIMIEYDKKVLEVNENMFATETFKEYVKYLIDYYGIGEDNDYSYLVIAEMVDGDSEVYANLRVR